jgi:hypothetical protein
MECGGFRVHRSIYSKRVARGLPATDNSSEGTYASNTTSALGLGP